MLAFEAEYTMVPFENSRGARPEVLVGAQSGDTAA